MRGITSVFLWVDFIFESTASDSKRKGGNDKVQCAYFVVVETEFPGKKKTYKWLQDSITNTDMVLRGLKLGRAWACNLLWNANHDRHSFRPQQTIQSQTGN